MDAILALDEHRRSILTEVEALKAERNAVSKEIGQMKDAATRQAKIEAMRVVGDKIAVLDKEVTEVEEELKQLTATCPTCRMRARRSARMRARMSSCARSASLPEFDFEPKIHWDLGPALGILDFERGVKITGSRFYVLSGAGARLQRALIAYMLDLHIRQGYTEQYTPFMVRAPPCSGRGNCPSLPIICTMTPRKTCGWCPPRRCR